MNLVKALRSLVFGLPLAERVVRRAEIEALAKHLGEPSIPELFADRRGRPCEFFVEIEARGGDADVLTLEHAAKRLQLKEGSLRVYLSRGREKMFLKEHEILTVRRAPKGAEPTTKALPVLKDPRKY